MKYSLFLSVVAFASLVKSDSTQNPLIPSGISQQCSSFLSTLDTDSSLASCVKPIVSATSEFGPSGTSDSFSASDISSALDGLCNAQDSCSDSSIRTQLTSFYSACTAELTGSTPNPDVLRIYDLLYILTPLKETVCAKDTSGTYCALKIGSGSSSSGLQKRDTVTQTIVQNFTAALVPNTTTFKNTGLAFLFLTPTTNQTDLCTSCTRTIITNYINYESSTVYAPGLPNSPILGNQPALYSAIQNVCGQSFLSGAVVAAGGISNGLLGGASSNGAERTIPASLISVGSLLGSTIAGLAVFL